MRKTLVASPAFFFLLAALLAAQTAPEVEITAEPSHHLLLQNRDVRVFSLELAPQASTRTHRHRHDHVFIALGVAEVSNLVSGRPPERQKLQDGAATFVSGGFAHQLRNLGSTPFRGVSIELLQAQKSPPAKWEEERGLEILEGGTQDILFVKDGVRVSEIDLQPGGTLPANKSAPRRLLVAVSDVDLLSHSGGKTSMARHLRAGEVAWMMGGAVPALMNAGKGQAKFIVLEFH